MSKNDLVVVTGAGGFIGGHLVRVLQQRGHTKIRAVDVKPLDEWYQKTPGVENQVGDLALLEPCRAAAKGARMIYNLAADMGGMGFIETNKAECMLSVLINTHMLVAAKEAGTERFFYSSSACVYNGDKQTRRRRRPRSRKRTPTPPCRKTATAGRSCSASACAATSARITASPPAWRAITTSTGPKAPTTAGARRRRPRSAARSSPPSSRASTRSRSGATASRPARSCTSTTAPTARSSLAASDIIEPLNIGSDELVSINRLVDIVEKIAGVKLKRNYKLDAPKGVRGRNSDNTLIKKLMNWAPSIRLEDGMEKTYKWIHDEMTSGKASVVNALPRAVAAQ